MNYNVTPAHTVFRYCYKYIVDGVWQVDPSTAIQQDELGFQNNILLVDSAQVR